MAIDLSNVDEGHPDDPGCDVNTFSRDVDGHDGNPEVNGAFHYNRQERLKNAPKAVQDVYNGNYKIFKPGLFKALVSTKFNRMVFFTLIICFAVVIFNGIFNQKNKATAEGIPLSLTAFSYEENIYVSLKLDSPYKSCKLTGSVPFDAEIDYLDAARSPVQVFNQTDIYQAKEAYLRTTYHDYDIFYVKAVVKLHDKEYELFTAVERR